MNVKARRTLRFVCAFVVPFLVQGSVLIAMQNARPEWLPERVGFAVLLLSAAGGFAFLKDELDRAQALLVGLMYFPLMLGLLVYFSLVVGVALYGEGP